MLASRPALPPNVQHGKPYADGSEECHGEGDRILRFRSFSQEGETGAREARGSDRISQGGKEVSLIAIDEAGSREKR